MALNLTLAELLVEVSVRRTQYNQQMGQLQKDLAKIPTKVTIDVALRNTGVLTAAKQIEALRNAAKSPIVFRANVLVPRGFSAIMASVNQVKGQLRTPVTIPVRMNARAFYVEAFRVGRVLQGLRGGAQLKITADRSQADASINLLMQHLQAAQAMTRLRFTGGGLGRMGGGGGGFLPGMAQGLGLPYASNPAAMAGMMVGMLGKETVENSIKTATSIQTQMAELRRIAGFKPEQAATFKKQLFNVGNEQAGVSMEDLFQISNIGARMGVADKGGPEGLIEFTKQLAMVKNAVTDVPTEQLANEMARILNAFKLGTDRVAGFGSALTAMDNISTASAQDILAITAGFAGTAKAIKLTLPQVVAFASVLKDSTLTNQLAASSFEQIFRLMASKPEKIAGVIGVSAKEFKDAIERDPMEALGMLIHKFKELQSTVEGQQFLADLGLKGVRTAGSLQKLSTMFDEVAKRTKIASDETGSLNALIAANAIKSETAESKFQKFKNAVTELADAIGEKLLPGLTNVVEGLTTITRAITGGGAPKPPGGQNAPPAKPPNPLPAKPPNPLAAQDAALDVGMGVAGIGAPLGGVGLLMASLMEAKEGGGSPVAAKAPKRATLQDILKFLEGGGKPVAVEGRKQVTLKDLQKNVEKLPQSGEKFDPQKMFTYIDRRQNNLIQGLAKTWIPKGQRDEFFARLGTMPTEKERRNRPGFSETLETGTRGLQGFAKERSNVQFVADLINGKPKRQHYQSGTFEELAKKQENDAINGTKDDSAKQTAESTKRLVQIFEELTPNLKEALMKALAATLS